MAEKDPYELIRDAEINLEEFIQWQIDRGATKNFRAFAEYTGKAQEVFKYAAILYPRFLLIEGAIVLADHYSEENWERWRKQHSPLRAARVVNHVHIEDYLPTDRQGTDVLANELGHLLAFFWQMAVEQQFPGTGVTVRFDGDVIDIFQENAS